MSTTKIEFAVQMKCNSCVEAVRKSFANVEGIKNVDINLKTGSVVVDTILSTEDIQKIFASSGRKAVVKGYAGIQAGVAVLETGSTFIQGIIRFIQLNDTCVIDGTVDGLRKKGPYSLSVHECGDVSGGCATVGDIFNPKGKSVENREYGHLGFISPESNGRATFRLEDDVIKLSDIVGRALVLSDGSKRLVCGIIARSSGLFENPKTICACDGVTIWDERNLPKSGL